MRSKPNCKPGLRDSAAASGQWIDCKRDNSPSIEPWIATHSLMMTCLSALPRVWSSPSKIIVFDADVGPSTCSNASNAMHMIMRTAVIGKGEWRGNDIWFFTSHQNNLACSLNGHCNFTATATQLSLQRGATRCFQRQVLRCGSNPSV